MESNESNKPQIESNQTQTIIDNQKLQILRNVRQELWYGALNGLITGFTISSIGFYSIQFIPLFKKHYTRNNYILTVLISSCVGSYVSSLTYGKNSMINQRDQLIYKQSNNKYNESYVRRQLSISRFKENNESDKS